MSATCRATVRSRASASRRRAAPPPDSPTWPVQPRPLRSSRPHARPSTASRSSGSSIGSPSATAISMSAEMPDTGGTFIDRVRPCVRTVPSTGTRAASTAAASAGSIAPSRRSRRWSIARVQPGPASNWRRTSTASSAASSAAGGPPTTDSVARRPSGDSTARTSRHPSTPSRGSSDTDTRNAGRPASASGARSSGRNAMRRPKRSLAARSTRTPRRANGSASARISWWVSGAADMAGRASGRFCPRSRRRPRNGPAARSGWRRAPPPSAERIDDAQATVGDPAVRPVHAAENAAAGLERGRDGRRG